MEAEIPEHLTNCAVCWLPYTQKKRIPLVGSCGHTICRSCVRSMQNSHCPLCVKYSSFEKETKNYLAYELLDHVVSFPEEDDDEPHVNEQAPLAPIPNNNGEQQEGEAFAQFIRQLMIFEGQRLEKEKTKRRYERIFWISTICAIVGLYYQR